MKNKQGFVMTETLVVTVFLATIFTFIYVSIIPLMGKYEDLIIREGDIDIVYKLYNIRKMIVSDANKDTMTDSLIEEIDCDSFNSTAYCNKMMEYLELSDYTLLYVDDIYTSLITIRANYPEIYDYIARYEDTFGSYLILLDNTDHTICHLMYKEAVDPNLEP